MMAKNPSSPPVNLRTAVAGKPDLVVHGADLTVTARALAKLLAEKCHYLFVHGGEPVIVEENDAPPTMRPAGVNEIIIAVHKLSQPIKYKDHERQEITLPDKVAELYLAMPEEWRLRPLTSFANGPMLRDDGTIYCERGYDTSTGVYIYNVPKITVPDEPSREDAKSALATLRHPFRTFAFADRIEVDETFSVGGDKFIVKVVDLKQPPGRDESAFLAALLTAVCRPSLPIAPAIAMRGVQLSGSGVGKKLLLNGVAHVAFGQGAPSVALGSGKEFEKGLVAAVIRPDPMMAIDNFNGRKLQSEALCTVLTDRPAMVRVLGVSELKEANPRMLVCILGNAFTFAEDLVRRNFVVEMDAKVENPELRKFAGDFLADIAQQRAQLLQAALIIWRYGRQQVKSNSPPLGGFELWSRWIRDPLVALGCQDPVSVAEIAKLKTSDPTRLETAEIFQTWWTHHRDNKVKANELNEAVKAALEPDAKKRSRQAVASLVAKLVGTRLAGFHLRSDKDDKSRGRWTAVSYRLEQVGEDESEQATDPFGPTSAPKPQPKPQPKGMPFVFTSSAEDDPDDWQFNRTGDDAAARPEPAAPEAPQGCTSQNERTKVECDEIRWTSSDPLYSGPVVAVPDLGPDELDEHGAPQTSTGESLGQAFIPNSQKEKLRERGFTDKMLLHLYPEDARKILGDPTCTAEKWFSNNATTADPVERWRQGFARLDPRRDPCAGFRTGEWPRIHNVIRTFLASPFVKHAADHGWTDRELFGVHPVVGVARPDCCGVLMTNGRGAPVTRVTPMFFQFGNLVGRKATLNLSNSIEVWKWTRSTHDGGSDG
jgi:hypothetical protein